MPRELGPKKLKEQLEKSIERDFVKKFKHGMVIKFFRRHWPDRMILFPDMRVAWIEFKVPDKDLEPGQRYIGRLLKKVNHRHLRADSAQEALEWANNIAREFGYDIDKTD